VALLEDGKTCETRMKSSAFWEKALLPRCIELSIGFLAARP
jgi:hypothetical protein